jgi:hypothetical protein
LFPLLSGVKADIAFDGSNVCFLTQSGQVPTNDLWRVPTSTRNQRHVFRRSAEIVQYQGGTDYTY